jgi:hypothetical protein
MKTFLAVYRGRTIGEARLVAVSVEPVLVAEVVCRLLRRKSTETDDVVALIERGRRQALEAIREEMTGQHRLGGTGERPVSRRGGCDGSSAPGAQHG